MPDIQYTSPSSCFDIQEKRNFKLVLEYDGSNYHGWQRQHGVLTIQEVLESRLAMMLRGPIRVRASGRTDAGVHAKGQVVNFYARTGLQPEEILHGLNSLLPMDIVILEAEEMSHSFHARFSASSKVYEYHILNRRVPSALSRWFAWHIRQPLALEPMADSLERIVGLHDFSAFMASGSSVSSRERWMMRASLNCPDKDWLVFVFQANGFLRHMVRNLVGTLVGIGRGRLTSNDFWDILQSKDRRRAGMTAPAHGLYLLRVLYENDGHCDASRGEGNETG
jgi:tRNA pseudouridine38-40 synthase